MNTAESKRIALVRYSRGGGYCYLKNPKAASSTILLALWAKEYQEGRVDHMPAKTLHKRDVPWPKLQDLSEITGDPYVFSLVRNPYTRILSCYLDKIADGLSGTFEKFCRAYNRPIDRDVTFEEFLSAIASTPRKRENPHWRPQVENLLLGSSLAIHFVGHFEHMKEDLPLIMEKVGAPRDLPPRTTHASGASEELDSYMTKEAVSLIRKKYAEDFSAFGYSEDFRNLKPLKRHLRFSR